MGLFLFLLFTEFYRVLPSFFSLIGISSTNVSCPFRSIGPATGYCFIQFFIVSLWIVPKGATKLGKNEKKNPVTPKSATFFFWRKSAPLSETRPVPWVVVLRLLLFFFCGNFRQKKNSLLGFLKPFGSSFVLFFTFSHLFWCCCCCCCCCCGPKKWRAKFNDHFLKKWIEFEFLCWFDYSGQFFVDFFKGLFIIKKKKIQPYLICISVQLRKN